VSIYTDNVTLGTAAVKIVPSFSQPQNVVLHNMTKSSNEYIFVGGSAVATDNSIHIDPGENLYLTLPPGDDLWAVSDPAGLEVGIFATRK
jgi:hypothetical protein